jgi:hypothetical protein
MPTVRLSPVELNDLKELVQEKLREVEDEYDDAIRNIGGNQGRVVLLRDDMRQIARILAKLQNDQPNAPAPAAPVAPAAPAEPNNFPGPPNENEDPQAQQGGRKRKSRKTRKSRGRRRN